MPLLRDDEITRALEGLPAWAREGHALRRQFTFSSFPEAVAFVSRLVPHAEQADHHPDVTINYRRVTVLYSTHSEGGITEKDVAGAKMADEEGKAAARG